MNVGDQQSVVVVDDDPGILEFIERVLVREQLHCHSFSSGSEILKHFESEARAPAVILMDLNLPDYDGLTLMRAIRDKGIETPVVVITARASLEKAVDAMRKGAFDVLSKPFDPVDSLIRCITQAMAHGQLHHDKRALEKKLATSLDRTCLIGHSLAMQGVRQMIAAVAGTNTTVLIAGETGTGKELVARLVHEQSPRSRNKFVPVNCGELASSVLESELFGHTKGAFTGATYARAGLFVSAHQGTIFLDEVGELPATTQTRLLRVLEDSEVRPVGSDTRTKINSRVVSATNRPLSRMVASGEFREDLYYRLKVFEIRMPPLRERREDIPEITDYLLEKHSIILGRECPSISQKVREKLQHESWPGNVRQLENLLERALILCDSVIEEKHLSLGPLSQYPSPLLDDCLPLRNEESFREARSAFERKFLQNLIEGTRGNRAEAARRAQLDPSNLRRLLRKYQLH